MTHYTLYFDGGARPNPGQGYGSWEILDGDGKAILAEKVKHGDQVTSNEAEYLTLKRCLLIAVVNPRINHPSHLTIHTDSTLLANQLTGKWRCKEIRLSRLRDRCLDLLKQFKSWEVKWNGRAVNVEKFGH